jgi:hypothetical protein
LLTGAFTELRGYGAEVCLVEYPLSSAYRRAAAAVPSFTPLRERLAQAAVERQVPFVDLTARVSDSLFGDSDHINAAGRQLVTGLVIDGCFASSPPRVPGRAAQQ